MEGGRGEIGWAVRLAEGSGLLGLDLGGIGKFGSGMAFVFATAFSKKDG